MNKLLLYFSLIAITISLAGLFRVYAQTSETARSIKRFGTVATNLYRGGQPDSEDLQVLKEMGVKKIINCRHEKNLVTEERKEVEALGLEYIHIPWTIYGPYKQEVFEDFFQAIADKDKKPVFVHCKRGSERTGVLAAAYKMKYQGVTLEEALRDTEQYNVKFIWRPFVKSKIKQFHKRLKNN